MLKKTFQTVDRVFRWFEEWSLFMAVMVALLVALANVILRKATADVNLYWSDEVVRKTIYFSTYIGCIAAVRSRSLIRIDALPQMLPKLKLPLTMFANLAVLVFSALMVRLGWQMTVMMYEDEFARTASLQIPEWIFYAVLPLMGAMMFFRTLLVMVEDWKESKAG
ncbi:TRAP transporter small permease [Geothermobacter hydrogeniphilus]|uniref:C4-dicarboxylate ABC transporter permease n=1 Tax=Geothermobacter hydrogeniphilus TaxID=1969733 RepID=A0A1X0Y270_9BACT|nr:TRAP transporter small permease subunit [Geothermobacter hydrogeniphilus]ORJ59236.1 C4-dicarboxylate ABC transporter permease [Geothermobacter hydrogeniphilus]